EKEVQICEGGCVAARMNTFVVGYLFLEVWPARQARNAAAACSRNSALLNLRRRGCSFAGGVTMGVPPLTSSTPRRRIRLRCFIRDQFVRPVMTPIDRRG